MYTSFCTSKCASASASACYCIPQCVRLIAGDWCLQVVDKDKRKVKPKDKSWVKIGWRTKNRNSWCVQKRQLGIGLPSATLKPPNVELVTTLLGSAFQATIVWGKKEHLKKLVLHWYVARVCISV